MNYQEAKEYYMEYRGKKTMKDCRAFARVFESENRITGISTPYRLPKSDYEVGFFNEFSPYYEAIKNGVSRRKDEVNKKAYEAQNAIIDKFIENKVLDRINKEYQKIEKLNPSIKKIKHDDLNFIQTFDIIHGVCSGYNVDDINHFINSTEQERLETLKKQRKFAEENNVVFNWMLSEKTISKVGILFHRKKERDLKASKDRSSTVVMSDEEEMKIRTGIMNHNYMD